MFFVNLIQNAHYRGKGTTDGTFRGQRYFTCADNVGLFVALDQIRPSVQQPRGPMVPTECSNPGERGSKNSGKPSPATSARGGKTYSGVVKCAPSSQPEKTPARGSSVDPTPSNFKLGQRVKFFDKSGVKYYGVVRWAGKTDRNRGFEYSVVGIECVS